MVLSSMPVEVVERLERRSGLAPAVGQDVELGLELLVALGRVARAADVGEDLAGLVVDGRRRRRCGCCGRAGRGSSSSSRRGSSWPSGRPAGPWRSARGRPRRPTSRRSAASSSRASWSRRSPPVSTASQSSARPGTGSGQLRRGPATRSAGAFQLAEHLRARTTGSSLARVEVGRRCSVPPVSGLSRLHQVEDVVAPLDDLASSAGRRARSLVALLAVVDRRPCRPPRRSASGRSWSATAGWRPGSRPGRGSARRAACRSSPWPRPSRRSCCCRRSSG